MSCTISADRGQMGQYKGPRLALGDDSTNDSTIVPPSVNLSVQAFKETQLPDPHH